MLVKNGFASQTWAGHSPSTESLNTTAAKTLAADAEYTIVATQDFWWTWGATATAEDAGNGYWPANIPLFIHTGANTLFAFVKNADAGYITFYRNG
jgi:hypothetical protein